MLQGTMSNVGKTLLTAGLCRVMRQDGFLVMPFKAQNMSLNSCITKDGLEMSRAQVMQAEAAGVIPSADMNPLLLKPTSHQGSQVILQGQVLENMSAAEFYRRKAEFRPKILESFHRLEEKADVILIEGAGSPVELNLRTDDLVNMGLAEMVDAPVLLIGDIDPGGVFAQLLGTLSLLSESERARVKGLLVNKFRGDRALFQDGVRILEERSGLPVVGVIPFTELALSDEDSMSGRLKGVPSGIRFGRRDEKGNMTVDRNAGNRPGTHSIFDIAVIRYPHISNFTDFDVFDAWPDMTVRYVTRPEELKCPDMLILPGSKNTIADLRWLRDSGFTKSIIAYAKRGIILGICGGYQMLGETIKDPKAVEDGGTDLGLGLLSVNTILEEKKVQQKREGKIGSLSGGLKELSGCKVSGYEIHMGRTKGIGIEGANGEKGKNGSKGEIGILCEEGNVYGTYLHGFFDAPGVIPALRRSLAGQRGIEIADPVNVDYAAFKEKEYDRLADVLRENLDMKLIYDFLK